jgi:hypothetical protein
MTRNRTLFVSMCALVIMAWPGCDNETDDDGNPASHDKGVNQDFKPALDQPVAGDGVSKHDANMLPVTVKGMVENRANYGVVPSATVTAEDNGLAIGTATTDKNGEFTLNLKVHKYSKLYLTSKKTNFMSTRRYIPVDLTGKTVNTEIQMFPTTYAATMPPKAGLAAQDSTKAPSWSRSPLTPTRARRGRASP